VNRYLVKIARQKAEEDKPHVIAAHKKLDDSKGLIVHWGTGAGKTKFFLDAAKKALDEDKKHDALIVAPASLVTNVDKELDKHKIKLDRKRLHVFSYEKANNISDELAKHRYSIAIADESQKLRNSDTQRAQSLEQIFRKADKRILATATANFNHGADVSHQINLAAGREVMPTKRKDFENRYLRKVNKPQGLTDKILGRKPEQEDKLIRQEELGEIFKEHVHMYDPKDDPAAKDKFPTITEKTVEVELSPEQQKYYKFLEGQMPFWLKMKVRHSLPLDKKEKAQLNAFSQGIRQVSNSTRHLVQNRDSMNFTPKIQKAVSSLEAGMKKDKNFKGLVYSNYLDAGVDEYSRALIERGIKHGKFVGSLSKEEKDVLKNDFNAGKMPVLIVSSSGSEGIDLKGVKRVQILDPHFNPSKIKQVIGRASRYESHTHLPKEERTVEVEHFLSVHPKGLFGKPPTSIDKYLREMSDDKSDVFDQIKNVMKVNS
jgi:SNF2 family DNA or RNA helicase